MRKHFIVPLAVALMMAALSPTPAHAAFECGSPAIFPVVTPSAQSVQQGATASYTVTVTKLLSLYFFPRDFWSQVSVTGLPAGFTPTFTANGPQDFTEEVRIDAQLAVTTTTGHLGTDTLRIIIVNPTATEPECGTISGGPFTLTVTDTTAPTTTAALAGTKGNNGYYTSAVTVTLAAIDPDGGADVASTTYTLDGGASLAYTAPFPVSGDGGHTVTFSSTDKAGDVETSQTLTIPIDTTAPTGVVGTPARAADANGWYTAPVTIAFSGTDATSGIASCTSTPYSGPDSATASVSGTCTDQAGNTSAPATFPLKYDGTKPTGVAGTAERAPDSTGWYNHPVKVTFGGTDATSGPPTCTSTTYSGPDGGGASVSGTCTDTAGNTSDPASFALTYDGTKPTLTPSVSPNPVPLNGTATATPNATDGTSGLASSSCATVVTSGVGAKTVSCTATDHAGNTNTATASYTVAYKVCLLYDPAKSVNAGGVIPLKIQLCDASGANVSASTITVHATGLQQVDGTASSADLPPSNANPDSDFRYDGTLAGYIYNLKTTGLARGTWKMGFTVTGDPVPHSIQFDVR
jgi:hypothetical protein